MRSLRVLLVFGLLFSIAACSGSAATQAPSAEATPAATEASTAPSTEASPAAEKIKIGLITKFPVDFFFTIENAAKEWAASHPEVELITGQGKAGNDHEGQIAIIESMVAQGVKGIAVTPTGPQVQPALDAAVAAGVKIVLIDNDLPDWTGKSAVVATDNHAGGVLAGQWLKENLAAGDTLAVLEGVAGVPALDARVKGMTEGLGDLDVKIVQQLPTDCDQVKGQDAADAILTANPDVKAIYGACGPPIIGALESIKNAGRAPDSIIVVGFDASPDELAALEAGTEDATVAQFPAKMGELGVDTVLKAVLGETIEANVDTGTAIVTKDNVADFK
jgi:ABC-type sugar transport system substrate-binding protein